MLEREDLIEAFKALSIDQMVECISKQNKPLEVDSLPALPEKFTVDGKIAFKVDKWKEASTSTPTMPIYWGEYSVIPVCNECITLKKGISIGDTQILSTIASYAGIMYITCMRGLTVL